MPDAHEDDAARSQAQQVLGDAMAGATVIGIARIVR